MRDPQEVQAELDAAQADLEANVGELKDIILDKLETPRKAVEVAGDVVAWLRRHTWIFIGATGVALALRRWRSAHR